MYKRQDALDELCEGLLHGFVGAVDVEMVGVYGRDDRHVGPQAEERAVELVGLDRQPRPVAQHQIAAEVFRDAAQKGASGPLSLIHI